MSTLWYAICLSQAVQQGPELKDGSWKLEFVAENDQSAQLGLALTITTSVGEDNHGRTTICEAQFTGEATPATALLQIEARQFVPLPLGPQAPRRLDQRAVLLPRQTPWSRLRLFVPEAPIVLPFVWPPVHNTVTGLESLQFRSEDPEAPALIAHGRLRATLPESHLLLRGRDVPGRLCQRIDVMQDGAVLRHITSSFVPGDELSVAVPTHTSGPLQLRLHI